MYLEHRAKRYGKVRLERTGRHVNCILSQLQTIVSLHLVALIGSLSIPQNLSWTIGS